MPHQAFANEVGGRTHGCEACEVIWCAQAALADNETAASPEDPPAKGKASAEAKKPAAKKKAAKKTAAKKDD